MKKLLLIVLAAALLLSVMPVFATPTAQLNDLARYFPADTPVFIASRFDDAYFTTLDSLIDRVRAAAPQADIPPLTIEEAFGIPLSNLDADLSFQGDIRPWLGDTIAAGVLEFEGNNTGRLLRGRMNNEEPGVVAVAITDRSAATSFLTDLIERTGDEVKRTEVGDFTVLTNPDDPDGAVLIGNDVLLITNVPTAVTDLSGGTLATNPGFIDVFARLPESDYNATLYLDIANIIQQSLGDAPGFVGMPGMFGSIFSAFGPQAWGFTILDDVNLTLDVVQSLEDTSGLDALGLSPLLNAITPIDPAFAVHVPANAVLMSQGANIGTMYLGMLDMVGSDSTFAESLGMDADDIAEAQESISELETQFTNFTELDLREDVLSWMTGNYAAFLALNPDANFSSMLGLMQTLPVDFGVAIEVTDPEAAANTVTGLTTGFDRLGALVAVGRDEDQAVSFEITTETVVGTEVSVLTLETDEMPWPVELLLGANGEVFAFGTRNAVQAILARDGGLPSNAAYSSAQSFLLGNAYSQFFLGVDGLLPLTDLAESMSQRDGDTESNIAALRNVMGLFQGVIASQSMDADGNSMIRVVLTLSE